MAYVGILLITILVSFVIVRIGGFALQLTGIEPEVATFQALSAFSGTGFTTTEAERVVRNRTRRRIVTILIILGNAGLVTIMATLVASITKEDNNYISFFLKLGVIIAGIFILYNLIIRSRAGDQIVSWFRKPLMKRIIREAPAIDEIYLIGRYWCISLVTVKESSKFIDLSLAEIMMEKDIQILEIDRAGSSLTTPDIEEKVMEGDRLLVYGNRQEIRRLLGT